MKRITIILIASAILASASFADQTYTALAPKNAESMALGGSFTSIPTAEFSFFGNPAAFAAKDGSLTLIQADAWAYVKPTSDNLDALSKLMKGDEANKVAVAGSLMPTNNGIGGGFSLGLGYAGKGLGIGVFAVSDNWADGDSVPGAVLGSDTEVSVIAGLGLPLQLGDSLRLMIGGDLRPFYRVRIATSLADFLSDSGSGSSSDDAYAGFGLAMDLGASLELGSFCVGLSVRDIAPPFPVWKGTLEQLTASVDQGSLPQPAADAEKAVFLPAITAGLSWKPELLPGLIDPSLYFELQDPVAVFRNADGLGSVLNLTHLGAEVRFLKILSLRAGLNRGWISVGGGLDLLFLNLDAAVFTEELGALPGDKPRSGFSLSAAIRF